MEYKITKLPKSEVEIEITLNKEDWEKEINNAYEKNKGKYNIEDTSDKYAHIVGNGESDTARSNAHTLDWDGKAWFASDARLTHPLSF